MSLTRCLKKMGLSKHEAAILKGAAADYREEGMNARDAAIMAVTDYIEESLREREAIVTAALGQAKKRDATADVQAALDAMPTFTRESMGIAEAEEEDASAIDEAAHEAATSPKNDLPQPTEAQKEAGNYQKGHARLIGLDLSIENPAGSTRSGTDAGGKAWSVTMRSHYGYIKGTVGKDKDHIDVFVKPGTPEDWTGPVFVIDQSKGNGHLDEHKVMLGFESEAEARAAYLENYTKGWDRLRAITETTPAEFKAWLKDGDTTRPFRSLSSQEWKNEGKSPADLVADKEDFEGRELARTIYEESREQDFKPTDLPAVVRAWASDQKISTEGLRSAVLKHLDSFDFSDGRKKQIRNALNPVRQAEKAERAAPAPAASPELDAALKDAQDALGDLADIFGKNVRSNLTPEQEQKLLPVLTRLFDAAFRAGYYSFRDAARWVLGQIRERIGTEVADALTTEHLQGAYIGMSGRHKATGNVTPAAQVVAIEKESIDAERSGPVVERDREDGDAGDAVGAQGVPNDGRADARGARAGGSDPAQSGAVVDRDREVPGDAAPPAGVAGDLLISTPEEPGGSPVDFPGSNQPGRGSDVGGLFGSLDPNADAAVTRAATGSAELRDKVAAQREANKLPVTFNDRANIDATLPFLLEGQREDVAYAEARWAKPDGYGVLFTNGTGTGKTFLALGAVRRMVNAGRGNGIIVVPDQTVLNAWVDSGLKLGLNVRSLSSTSDPGADVAITTYANFGANLTLADRPYDFVIMDEAHNLKVGQQNEDTTYLLALRAISMHPDGTLTRAKMIHRDLYAKMGEARARVEALSNVLTDDMMDAMLVEHRKAVRKADEEDVKLRAEWAKVLGEVTLEVAGAQGALRPRAMFLSATPFAYDKNVDWANGYLFEYGPPETGGYNTPSPYSRFMMTHFGYRMRYGKLTSPPKEVNTDLMERTFNTWLRKAGVLSSRTLDVPFDYDRRFVAVESLIGRRIDEAMEWLRTSNDGALTFLREQLAEKFDYLSRARLLEALKAAAAVDYIKKHHALGRKVVVWYDFNEGGGFNAFKFYRPPAGTMVEASVQVNGKWERKPVDVNDAVTKFEAQFPDLVALNTNLPSPLETLTRAFPQAVQNNGVTPKAKRLENIRAFNDDSRPDVNIILVQSAANAGWSGHDTTGKHMRVTVNLGLPTQPHKSIQQEGRTYRVGQMSDTSHTYFNTGTTWEVVAFAQRIARRAGTVENLANGEQARGLADAFIQAFESSEEHEPGPDDGKGGKASDRALAKVMDEFDRAVALYYANEKKNSRTKAAEGTDYFATPEPLGLAMVRWADPRPGDSFLEPSAGHGAIARFFPEQSQRVMVEESPKLAARLGLAAEGDIINGRFEDYHVVNKFSTIVMNPPFEVGGKVAIEHLMKAARHLKDGGRIVALLPRGPAADKRLEKFLYEGEEKALQPLAVHPTLGPIFKGDTISTNLDKDAVVERMLSATDVVAKEPGMPSATAHKIDKIIKVEPTGDRTTSVATNLYLAADIILPTVTFERAGTAVATHVIVLEKQTDPALAQQIQQQNRDYTSAESINEFFERIRDSEIRPRVLPAASQAAAAPAPAAAAAAPAATGTVDRGGLPIVEHVTGKGKTLRGIVRTDLTQAQAKDIDAFTFKKDGGWFIREKHLKPEEGMLSRAGQSAAARFQRASQEDIAAAVADLKKRLPGAPPIFVVQNTSDPRIARSLARRMAAANAEGAYEGGRVYIVAPEIRSMEHAEGLLAHEVFHAALDLMGDERSALLRSMQEGNETLRTEAAALRARFPDMGELESVEEVLADYAREGREPTLLQRWSNFIRTVLRKVGLARIATGWTDAEVLGLVADAPRRAFAKRRDGGVRMYTEGRLMRGSDDEDVYRTVGGGRARQGFPEATRIRGADGRPGTTYRGATRELSPADFALDALGRASGNPSSGLGVWFAADEGIASRFGEVSRFQLDIRNPLVVRPETIPGFDSVEEAHRFRGRARAKGYDGIIVDGRHLGGPVYYVAFEPEQVVVPRPAAGRLSRPNQNLAQPLSEARYSAEDQARAERILASRRAAQPLDAVARVPMQALRLDKVTATVIDGVLDKLASLASTVAPQAWEKAKAGLVDQYGLPEDVKDQRSAMQGRMRAGVRSSKHAIDALANLTRQESRVLYEYVNGDRSRADLLKEGLSEESVKIIDLYQQVADEMGREAVRLGQLSADAFERHRWAYVHRSYQKHVLDMPEQAKVERSRALKIRGDQYKGRGMSQPVPMKALQNIAPDWWGRKLKDGKGDTALRGQEFIRFDRRAAVGEGTADLEGFGTLGRRGRILETHYWPAGEPVPAKYGAWERDAAAWTVRDTKGGNVIVARDFTQAERQAMGEVDEIRYGMAATLHKMIHDIEVGRMLEYVAVNHGKTDETLPQGANIATDSGRMFSMTRAYTPDEWVLVPESKIPGTSARAYGALAGLYVPGPIWNDVRQIVNTNMYPLGETYADLLRAWKLSKTALSLPVHMNNVMSNVLMADFHDVGAKDVLAALDVIRHQDRPENAIVLERFEDAGGSEGLYNLTELQKQTIQPLIDQLRAEVDAIDPAQGIARVSSIVTLITQMRFREAFALAAQSKAGKSGAFVRDKLVKAYENEDLVFRLAAFIRAKGDGMADVEAGRRARQSFLDYQINAPWINLMRSTAFPFISFTYRALPMMVDTFKTKPWKIVKWGGIMGLLNLIGYAASGGDEDKERRLLPEEVAGRTILGSPKLLRAPWNDANDSPVFLDVRRWIPVGDIVDWGQTHSVVPFFPQLMPSGPAGLFAELALNKSAFTGQPITQDTDTAAEKAGKLSDYLYKAFAPNTPGVPFAYSTEKILTAGGGKTDAFGREQSVVQAASSSVGVKLASYPTDVLQRNAVIQYRARDAEIKANIAKLGRELQRKGIDPEEFEKKLQRQQQKRIELNEELAKKLGAGAQ